MVIALTVLGVKTVVVESCLVITRTRGASSTIDELRRKNMWRSGGDPLRRYRNSLYNEYCDQTLIPALPDAPADHPNISKPGRCCEVMDGMNGR